MVATELAVRRIVLDGLAGAAESAFNADGMFINNNDGRIWVECTETGGSATKTLTFATPGTVGDQALAVADDSRVIPIDGVRRIGPFPVDVYGETVNMTVAGSGTLTIAAYRLAGS